MIWFGIFYLACAAVFLEAAYRAPLEDDIWEDESHER
jgi:hypothetical protein